MIIYLIFHVKNKKRLSSYWRKACFFVWLCVRQNKFLYNLWLWILCIMVICFVRIQSVFCLFVCFLHYHSVHYRQLWESSMQDVKCSSCVSNCAVVVWLSAEKSWVLILDINQSECKSSKLAEIWGGKFNWSVQYMHLHSLFCFTFLFFKHSECNCLRSGSVADIGV